MGTYKPLEFVPDDDTESSGVFIFTDEDHTMGNAVRYMLMRNRNVTFCGYTVPHPLEDKMNMRIQTTGMSAPEALCEGLQDLTEMAEHVLAVFEEETKDV